MTAYISVNAYKNTVTASYLWRSGSVHNTCGVLALCTVPVAFWHCAQYLWRSGAVHNTCGVLALCTIPPSVHSTFHIVKNEHAVREEYGGREVISSLTHKLTTLYRYASLNDGDTF